ncbi:hypothetical protein AAX26_00428 [Aliarcobacter thereius]|uniref:Uncharacterized protein n=1 Tax=Aliarcobacter thereius LMG 24486 TaxID=1032240 RepID=A0A1C7WPL5_9BACT|nr:hypothetical protein [Aliarcobacter thereius]OCL88742.1 hypothetical protein AAX26_00428 [Aliarcobacter thereius]OCL92237.1 hypothetical protein AAX25_00967 [Aliarcobacter thereius]OCL94667.1 hypothetical protein AA347_00106 [Aliarcobacter thereius LMG 24486]QBF15457.1 putative membrane protein [Aliarcobacter thereius LMG 24486]
MIVEKFSQNLINSGIFKLYVAIGFCATLIFFVLNSDIFSPLEMVFGAVFVTMILKGTSNVVFSFIMKHFSLDKRVDEFNHKYNEEKVSFLLNQFKSEDYIDEEEEVEKNLGEDISQEELAVNKEIEVSQEEKTA